MTDDVSEIMQDEECEENNLFFSELEQFVENINKEFNKPFLDITVSAQIKMTALGRKYLNLRIGCRDVDFNADGNVIGCGTLLLDGKEE